MEASAQLQRSRPPSLIDLPGEILDMILEQVSSCPDPYKCLFALARTRRALAAHALPWLYYRDVVESPKLPRSLDIPSALQWACWFGVLETAKASLEALARTGADVGTEISKLFRNGNLHRMRHNMMVRRAVDNASGYLYWKKNSSLLHLACMRGNTAIAELLIENGVHADILNGASLSPLAYVLNADVARLLIQHGAEINATHGGDETALCHLISSGPLKTRQGGDELNVPQGNGALQPWHTTQDVFGAIEFLIKEAGADIYPDTIGTVSPLQEAVKTRHVKVVKLLLAAGASPSPTDTSTGRRRLLLADALRPGYNQQVVKLMLDAGAEADAGLDEEPGESRDMPIMNLTLRASDPLNAKEEVKIAHMVCERVKNIDADIDGHPALWHYVTRGRQDIGQVLIEHGADPEKANVEAQQIHAIMPYFKTSQEWLEQSIALLEARPSSTRITTKYSLRPVAARPDDAAAATTPKPPRGSLVLKTYDPVSGVTLKYRTTKAAEVSRLVHASLGRLGRSMAAVPDVPEVSMQDAGDADEQPMSQPAPTLAGQASQGGGGGKKKKKGKK
ncbi:hypothetical protein FZEAL_4447 [Fusarium zealandicum]|uniref:SRP9 domain-containing protein n=1 Tax=Fusarium zealandicum TaxID=1053134 RepID=A0A8H4UME3_9HYPO|nr:hypothetical protein FZEAL_4447 [Fusarium zealandicum]